MSGGVEGEDRRKNIAWHMKKEIPIATILSIVASIFIGSWWMVDMRSDINQNARDLITHASYDEKYRTTERETSRLILKKLDAIQAKVSEMEVKQALRYGQFLQSRMNKEAEK